MNTQTILMLVMALILSGCGKNFTPASKKDLEEATSKSTQKTQQAQICVNENIFVTFEPTEVTAGQVTVEAKVSLESTMQYGLYDKALRYEAQRKTITYGNNTPGDTLKKLKPTVLNRLQSDKLANRAFIKYLCANANAASLVESNYEKRNPNDKSMSFNYRFDAVQETWACYGPCTQD